MIAIKDAKHQIVARSMIKLLWSREDNEPVLFFEHTYSNNPRLDSVIEKMAEREARRLNIKLVVANKEATLGFYSYPNRTGFEYEDSSRVTKEGWS
jgi:hypothetical protein